MNWRKKPRPPLPPSGHSSAEAERKVCAEKQEAEAIAFRQIGGLVRKAHSALSEGSTGRAAGLRRAIEEKLPSAPPLPPHLTTSIQLLDKKLEELKDWKSFSVAPKRIELMEEMESLVGATLEPVGTRGSHQEPAGGVADAQQRSRRERRSRLAALPGGGAKGLPTLP